MYRLERQSRQEIPLSFIVVVMALWLFLCVFKESEHYLEKYTPNLLFVSGGFISNVHGLTYVSFSQAYFIIRIVKWFKGGYTHDTLGWGKDFEIM